MRIIALAIYLPLAWAFLFIVIAIGIPAAYVFLSLVVLSFH